MSQRSGGRAASGAPPAAFRRLAAEIEEGAALVAGGRIAWASERLAELLGRASAKELVGTLFAEPFQDAGGKAPEAGSGRAVECELPRPSGGTRRVRCRRAAEEPVAGAALWLVEDVTRLRTLEAELFEANRALHDRNREVVSLEERLARERSEREELLGVVSHELRTPVTVISGYHRLLLSGEVGELTDEQREFLLQSRKSCQRLDAFIGNLLEASRQDAGDDAALEVRNAPLGPVIEDVLAQLRPLLADRDLRADVRIDPGAARARFDPARVEQVLTNLVDNAIKHSDPGGRIAISTAPAPAGEEDAHLVAVAVEDEGPGVDPEERERIFAPYVRGAGSRSGGLGIGLAICRRLVRAHGGTLEAGSGEGGGGRFVFTLPAAETPGPGGPDAR